MGTEDVAGRAEPHLTYLCWTDLDVCEPRLECPYFVQLALLRPTPFSSNAISNIKAHSESAATGVLTNVPVITSSIFPHLVPPPLTPTFKLADTERSSTVADGAGFGSSGTRVKGRESPVPRMPTLTSMVSRAQTASMSGPQGESHISRSTSTPRVCAYEFFWPAT